MEVVLTNGKKMNVIAPLNWSRTAVSIVAERYLAKLKDYKEDNIETMFKRVLSAFSTLSDADKKRLLNAQLAQEFAFNSPVYFNIGLGKYGRRQQGSACFILEVNDSMESLLNWQITEAEIFRGGSGSGINISRLRAEGEPIASGGTSSGPLSFMRAVDGWAGIIKSGGVTRRAAKMVIMDADHPDIIKFIESKVGEERKAKILAKNGFGHGIDSEAYRTVAFQNENHSVRVTDEFMKKVDGESDDVWMLTERVGGDAYVTSAKKIMRKIAEATWECGDPGIQFADTINNWSFITEEIRASNPCSEFLFIDNSACNLASINILKFIDGSLDIKINSIVGLVRTVIRAMDELVDISEYPTPEIMKNSHFYRPLGLGITNLGGTLMMLGIPYDSPDGYTFAASIMALVDAAAVNESVMLAEKFGPAPTAKVESGKKNPTIEKVKRVIGNKIGLLEEMVSDVPSKLKDRRFYTGMIHAAINLYKDALEHIDENGIRNLHLTAIAPTGTISLMMDAHTTGIEPEFSLIRYKTYVDGPTEKFVNPFVESAIKRYVSDDEKVKKIIDYIWENDGDASEIDKLEIGVEKETLANIKNVLKTSVGKNALPPEAHIEMVSALQPFVTGGISKTVNVPADITVDEIEDLYKMAWKNGVKCVAIYRDGSKDAQPLTTTTNDEEKSASKELMLSRKRLPHVRNGQTVKMQMGGIDGYFTVNTYPDNGMPGEIFIEIASNGSTFQGAMHAFAIAVSLALQYGVPLEKMVEKFENLHFEPGGITGDPEIPFASSFISYIFKWLKKEFLEKKNEGAKPSALTIKIPSVEVEGNMESEGKGEDQVGSVTGMLCSRCGGMMIKTGTCYTCLSCGETTGCA